MNQKIVILVLVFEVCLGKVNSEMKSVYNSDFDSVAVLKEIAQFKLFGEQVIGDISVLKKLFNKTKALVNTINEEDNERYVFTIAREDKIYYYCVYSSSVNNKVSNKSGYKLDFDNQIIIKVNKLSFRIEGVTFGG